MRYYEVRRSVEHPGLVLDQNWCHSIQDYQVQSAGRDEGRYLDEKRQENGDELLAGISSRDLPAT